MWRNTLAGAISGTVGTFALDFTTYADMAIRGRSSSNAPSQLVKIVSERAGLPTPSSANGHKQEIQNRENGVGSLLGYVNGVGMGMLYGLVRSRTENVSTPLAGIVVGLAAMAASDVPLVSLGISNPKTWGLSGWLSDLIPHLIYGLVTVSAYEAFFNNQDE
jgi:hypothetical protein